MENTVETGLNRTGQDMAPASRDDMVRFAHAAAPAEAQAGGQALAQARRDFALDAGPVGSVPVPMKMRGLATAAMEALKKRAGVVQDVDLTAEQLRQNKETTRDSC